MIPQRANAGEGRAMRLAATMAILLVTAPCGVAAANPNVCAPPKPHTPMTVERLRSQGGDATPEAAAMVNALFVHDDCLHAAAWRMRGAGDRLHAVRRVMAGCRATLRTYEALELKLARTPADLAEARSDGARKERGIAERYVDDYGGCGR